MTANCVHYYYRMPDQPVRRVGLGKWQEAAGLNGLEDIAARVDRLTQQGYVVDAVELTDVCPECQSTGVIAIRPYGMRRAKFDALTHKPSAVCPICDGQGVTHRHVIRFGA